MMSFCKKSVHSLVGLTIPMSNNTNLDDLDHHNHKPKLSLPVLTNSTSTGLGLITVTDIDTYKTPPNVLESTTFKSSSPPPTPTREEVEFVPIFKKDPGGIGFIDDIGGGVNGLMSCTESLGFESCDERRVDDEMDELCLITRSSSSSSRVSHWRKSYSERKEVKKFPPPLSSLNHNGQPSFFLKPVRKDGRLELTEVRIDRPEILRASRENGRLRLHLIRDNEEEDDQEEEEEDNDDYIQENEEMLVENQVEEVKENEEIILVENKEEEEVKENELLEEEIAGEWRFPVTGEGFRRCHELVSHHHGHHNYHHHHHNNHHHNLHVWSQHCVPTR